MQNITRRRRKPPTVLTGDGLDGLTVPQLKDKLRPLQLKLAGRKSELVARLRAHYASSDGSEALNALVDADAAVAPGFRVLAPPPPVDAVRRRRVSVADLFLHPVDAADGYNPTVGDRVTFRRGTHNGRAKAVEVRLIMDPREPAVAPCWAAPARTVSPGQAPAMRGENRHVSLGPRGSPRA